MNDDRWTVNEWLMAIGCGSLACGWWPVSIVCGIALLVRFTAIPAGKSILVTGKIIGKGITATARGTKKMFTPKAKVIQPPPLPTKSEDAKKASGKYEEACELIDEMPLEGNEKDSMKIHAKRKLIGDLWGLLK